MARTHDCERDNDWTWTARVVADSGDDGDGEADVESQGKAETPRGREDGRRPMQ